MNLMEESPDELEGARALQLDDSTRTLLAARMELDIGATSDRFVVAAADAFVASAKMGRSAAVTTPLKRAVDSLGAGEPVKAVDMILELREAVVVEGKEAETNALRDTLTSEVLSSATLLEVLKGSAKLSGEDEASYVEGMSKVLASIQAEHFDSALAYLPDCPPGKVREMLLELLGRLGKGNELKIAALFAKADVDLGLALVRLFATMDSPEAREAVSHASQSPHALVRIEALGHLEGVSGPRLRNELKKLVEDDDPEVRMAALHAMKQHAIVIAGPFLVLRIQDKGFGKLSYEERQKALETLCHLRPKRGEEVCMALLQETQFFRPTALEETRELAAGFLAEVAASDQALHLLEEIASSGAWKNSKRVRDAASAAIERLQARAKEAAEAAERRRAERKTLSGAKAPTADGAAQKKKRKTTTGSNTVSGVRSPSVGGTKAPSGPGRPSKAEAAASKTPSGADDTEGSNDRVRAGGET
jgi:hypothetical protein